MRVSVVPEGVIFVDQGHNPDANRVGGRDYNAPPETLLNCLGEIRSGGLPFL